MIEDSNYSQKKRSLKKMTQKRLKNIALYYLKRFDSSIDNLRQVLMRRVNDYAFQNPEWRKDEAYDWIENILAEFQHLGYLDDARYAEIKIKNYISSGKSARYITGKLKQKGISETRVAEILDVQDYDPMETALHFARKKGIGPFRREDQREAFKQKDLGTLVRAGFDYDTVISILSYDA